MTPEEINALDALVKAATPGEWYRELHPDGDPIDGPNGSDVESDDIAHQGERIAQVGWGPDAAAIVALHNAAPALIAAAREVERLRAFVPVWRREGTNWRLYIGRALIGEIDGMGFGLAHVGVDDVLCYSPVNGRPDVAEAARAVCARLGIPDVGVPSE